MNFRELQMEYGGKFVAILEDKVLTSGKTFNEVMAKLQSTKISNKNGLSIRFINKMMPKIGVEQHDIKKETGDSSSRAGGGEQTSGNHSIGTQSQHGGS